MEPSDILELRIDTTSANLRILGCTVSVTSILGPVELGTGLLDLLPRRNRATFLWWVQEGGTAPTTVKLRHNEDAAAGVQSQVAPFSEDAHFPGARCLVLSDVVVRMHRSASPSPSPQGTGPQGQANHAPVIEGPVSSPTEIKSVRIRLVGCKRLKGPTCDASGCEARLGSLRSLLGFLLWTVLESRSGAA